MRIQILSDLHVEFEDFRPVDVDADIVILAGDINVKGRCVDWAKEAFTSFDCPVLLCAGNHDYYDGHLGKTLLKMTDASDECVRFFDCNEWIVSGVRFLGATGWTDYTSTGNQPLAMWDASNSMTDFKKIRCENYRKIRPEDLVARSHYTKNWLRARLLEPFEGKTVVFTHHAPSTLSLDSHSGPSDHLDAAYANRWEDLMGEGVDLWVHGHTHRQVDYIVCGTRVITNPRGYPGESCRDGFDPGFAINV